MADERKQMIADSIRGIPDFPKPGILFWDVTTLMLQHSAFQATIDMFYDR
jgi:adenine phosphoribosyltransferase